MDAVNVSNDGLQIHWSTSGGGSHHIRLHTCEIKNAPKQGILVAGSSHGVTHNEFVDLVVHHNGTTGFHHGLYICTANNLVQGCNVNQNAGWGIHVYEGKAPTANNNNVVRNNRVHDDASDRARGAAAALPSPGCCS